MTGTDTNMEFMKQAFGGAWVTQGIAVAAELGIADLLAEGERTVDELAEHVGAKSDALYRVLRALAGVGVFSENGDRRFSLTPLAECLRTGVPGSQRALAIMLGTEFHGAWGELLHTVRTGEEGFRKRFGLPFFEYMESNPRRHSIYDAAMNGIHGPETAQMLAAYDFSDFRTVVDVGGGTGQTLAAILSRHSGLQGVLFDLPTVAGRARTLIAESGVADRCRVEGGDFLTGVPAGADAYMLRHVIHDWEDAEATAILRRCREAMRPGGRVLVVETVLPDGNEPSFGKWLDIMMLLVGGRERGREEYERLFSEAGLQLNRFVPTAGEIGILEGVEQP